ncbi:hypothetical protein MTHERMOG20_12600 [Moorella thermoacetica]|uniref:Colicin V production protein n=1 Tax=Moorella thermoacetica (strain ATCC 39073 / JCM 9320) TaxID=264732 RepID=Q2RM78_MOOTA|nr:hypothetical protein [Moorella thermoacetica]AKX92951.1 colicin V production protein [Moorella thermoacetica]AKX95504.1 colicin V production protein [Moorella thermoacetica]OIQ56960.1 colicin V production protein [Moorella thermoacetica]OIQ62233.1 colicin V production protein [Moorella thermoacetica]QCZ99312.1 Colicin V production protein [Moorella thermoacetica]
MLNYLDLILLIILARGAWRGYRLGLVNLLAGWISYLVAGLVSAIYSRPLAEIVNQTWHLTGRWGGELASRLPLPGAVLNQPLSTPAIRQTESFLSGLPLPGPVQQNLLGALDRASGGTVGQVLAGQIAFLGLELLILVVLFYGSFFLLRHIARRFSPGTRGTVEMADRGLGLLLGVLGPAFGLALAIGILRSLFTIPSMTAAPVFLPLVRQLHSSGVAAILGDFYDWLATLLHTLI